jgi:hypothetical protein
MSSTLFKSIKGSRLLLTNNASQIILGNVNTTTITSPTPTVSRIYTIPDTGANSSFIMSDLAQTIAGTKTFSSAIPITATTNQLVLGTTNTTTISASAPAASRIYTIPDVSTNTSFVMGAGAQTIAGTKTFSSAIPITATTNQLVLGTTNTTTITSPAPTASRIYTIPDTGANSSFIMSDLAQTINGAKSFSSLIQITAVSNQLRLGGVTNITINAPAPTLSRFYTLPDTGTNSSFVMTDLAQTINGIKTFSSAIPITATTNQLVLGTTNTTTITSPAPTSSRIYTIPDTGADSNFVMTDLAQNIGGTKTFTSGSLLLRAPLATNSILQLNGNNTDTATTGYQLYVPSANNKITIASKSTGADLVDVDETNVNIKETVNITNVNANFRTWIQNTAVATGGGTANIGRISFTATMTMIAEFKVYSIDSGGASSTFISTYEIKNTAGTVTFNLLFTTADSDQTIIPAVAANIFYMTITRSGTLTKNVVTYINVLNTSSGSFSIPDTVT